jgi:hypothetical protein
VNVSALLLFYFKTIIKYKDSYVFLLGLFSVYNDEKTLFLKAEEINNSLAQAFSYELASGLLTLQ